MPKGKHNGRLTGQNSPNFRGYGRISAKYVSRLRKQAKRRDHEYPLLDGSMESNMYLDSLATEVCPFSGWPLIFQKTTRDNTSTASLDRIDPKQGYIRGNVRWIHKVVNEMKWDLTDEEFLSLVRDIATTHSRP